MQVELPGDEGPWERHELISETRVHEMADRVLDPVELDASR